MKIYEWAYFLTYVTVLCKLPGSSHNLVSVAWLMQHKEQEKQLENTYRKNFKRPNKVKSGKLRVMKGHAHLSDTLGVTNPQKPCSREEHPRFLRQLRFHYRNVLSARIFAVSPFYCSFGSYCNKLHKVNVKCPFCLNFPTWPDSAVLFWDDLMDQGLPPPSPSAGHQQLGYYICLQCKRLKFKPLNVFREF